eukprot:6200070-Pleurochrysis_carterae.AAC.3
MVAGSVHACVQACGTFKGKLVTGVNKWCVGLGTSGRQAWERARVKLRCVARPRAVRGRHDIGGYESSGHGRIVK